MVEKPERHHAPATLRNREPILTVLKRALPPSGLLSEIASGSGEHAAFIAPRLGTAIEWQPTDANADALSDIDAYAKESGCPNIRPAIYLDVCASDWGIEHVNAIFCANMIHIAPWATAEGLFTGAAHILPPSAPLILYGPFRRKGAHTAPSNEEFDASLKRRDPLWGVRCLDSEVIPLAQSVGFGLAEIIPMPANNLSVIFRRVA